MNYLVSTSFDAKWILEHSSDAVLPVERIFGELKELYADRLSVVTKSFTELNVVIECDDLCGLRETVEDILNRGTAGSDKKVYSLDIIEFTPSASKDEPAASENCDASEALKSRVGKLIGCDDFKALINEYIAVAPQIKERKTLDSINFQNYIFSIDDGCGLTTCLDILKETLDKLGLFRFAGKLSIEEIKLSPGRSESEKEMYDRYVAKMNEISGGKLVCFDLSEIMQSVKSPDFRNFLTELEKMENKYVIAFRIPYVEQDVFDDVCEKIGDVLYLRKISVAPRSVSELRCIAEDQLSGTSFSMMDDAWEVFETRVREEKSDGRFYGVNTVRKIVNEIVYCKQLNNANKAENSSQICKDDIICLSKTHSASDVTAEEMLDSLIGVEAIKEQLFEVVAQIEHAVSHKELGSPCIHMRFVGNPGTGKTTIARIVGKLLAEKGILRKGHFFEYSGRDFCGRYIGETAPKTAGMCRDAYGSVLFIDEAYSLYTGADDSKDYGREALTTLIAEMENHRNDLVVIMAGYKDDMSVLMQGNAGLESRMPYVIEFPNYDRVALADIFMKMANKSFSCEEGFECAVRRYFDSLPDEFINAKDFSNARFVRNLFERTWSKAASRTRLENADEVVLKEVDFKKAVSACGNVASVEKKKNQIGF